MRSLVLTHKGVRYSLPTPMVLELIAAIQANGGYRFVLGCSECKTACSSYYPATTCECCEERRLHRTRRSLNPHHPLVDTATFVEHATAKLVA